MLSRRFKCLLASLAIAVSALAMGPVSQTRNNPPSRAWGVYGFKSYGGDQGLTTLSVSVMAQDQSGFLWVGTEDGLFRYDGESFHRFGSKDGLPDTNIIALAAAPDGSLWVLSQTGLAHLEGGRFVTMSVATGLPKADNLIPLGSAMACDAQSRLWICTRQGVYEGGPSGFWPVEGIPKGVPTCVSINSSDGTILLAQLEGVVLRKGQTGGWEKVRLPIPFEHAFAVALVQDTDGRIWARGDRFIFRYEPGLKGIPRNLSSGFSLKAIRNQSLFADAEGKVWAPTESGVVCFQGDSTFLLDESWGLPDTWVGSVLVDREGSLWVGSEGVHRVLGRLLWTASTRKQGLPSDTIWSVARTADGRVWAGTQGGLAVGDASGWHTIPELKGQAIFALSPDGGFGLWVGVTRPGTRTSGLRHFLPGGANLWVDLPGVSPGDIVQSLSRAEDGTVWVASMGGKLWRIPAGGVPIPVPILGLDSRANTYLVLARAGNVFVSTDHGLAVMDQGVWRIFGPKDGLKTANCQALAVMPAGEVWVTFADNHEISVLKRVQGSWTVAPQVTTPALIEDGIVSMAVDAGGSLWLGTSRGVKRWDGQTCRRFGRGEGLPGEDADGNAIWVDKDGAWFGMSNGLAHFDTRGGLSSVAPPSARVMSAVDGGGHSLDLGGGLLRVPFAYRTMDFDYAVPSFLNENIVRLQVRLQGFEDQWRDTKIREARYTALPPGDYRFEARAAIGDGPFGNADTLDFRILTPWWRAWWFYGFCFVFVTAIVLASVRWRTAVLEHRNRDLESLIRARTMDLERANEQLKETSMVDALTGLKNRRYLSMNLPEEEGRVLRAFRGVPITGQRPSGEDIVFLLVDLDHFKIVNDTYGHAVGDIVLRLVADAIRAATRDSDTVARWGGEEFLVIARRSDRQTADIIARKIMDEVRGRLYSIGNGQELRLTCSVGFSAFPLVLSEPGAFGWEEVVELADQCLYAAKRTGRDAYVGVFLDSLEVDPVVVQRLVSDLPDLVAEKKIEIRTSVSQGRRLNWKQGH